MFEIFGGDFFAADAARFGGLGNFCEQAFAAEFPYRRETFPGFIPAGAQDQAFGALEDAPLVQTNTARAPRVAPTRAAKVFRRVSWSRHARDTLASSKREESVYMVLPGAGGH